MVSIPGDQSHDADEVEGPGYWATYALPWLLSTSTHAALLLLLGVILYGVNLLVMRSQEREAG